jgi:hypothetical protein
MKIFTVLFLIFVSTPTLACLSQAPESIVKAMIAGQSVAGKDCSELPEERCVCFDGKDLAVFDLIDGELVENSDKKFARGLREKADKDAEDSKKARRAAAKDVLKSFSCAGANTVAAAKKCVDDLASSLRDILQE